MAQLQSSANYPSLLGFCGCFCWGRPAKIVTSGSTKGNGSRRVVFSGYGFGRNPPPARLR